MGTSAAEDGFSAMGASASAAETGFAVTSNGSAALVVSGSPSRDVRGVTPVCGLGDAERTAGYGSRLHLRRTAGRTPAVPRRYDRGTPGRLQRRPPPVPVA